MVMSLDERNGSDDLETRFDSLYPAAVGLARRVLDRDGSALARSLPVAEELALDALVRAAGVGGTARTLRPGRVVALLADGCLERLVGHPGTVPLHPELLGPDIEFDGTLPMAELQEALCDLRRRDRRVGVLVLAAGLEPTQTAALLDLPLPETLRSLARIGTRLADGRRVRAVEVHPA